MIAGGYTLHLYCENYNGGQLGEHQFNEFPHEYYDELGSRCRAAARKQGWKFDTRTGVAFCPKCTKRKTT